MESPERSHVTKFATVKLMIYLTKFWRQLSLFQCIFACFRFKSALFCNKSDYCQQCKTRSDNEKWNNVMKLGFCQQIANFQRHRIRHCIVFASAFIEYIIYVFLNEVTMLYNTLIQTLSYYFVNQKCENVPQNVGLEITSLHPRKQC